MHGVLLDSLQSVHNMIPIYKCFTERTKSYLKLKQKIDKGAFK